MDVLEDLQIVVGLVSWWVGMLVKLGEVYAGFIWSGYRCVEVSVQGRLCMVCGVCVGGHVRFCLVWCGMCSLKISII